MKMPTTETTETTNIGTYEEVLTRLKRHWGRRTQLARALSGEHTPRSFVMSYAGVAIRDRMRKLRFPSELVLEFIPQHFAEAFDIFQSEFYVAIENAVIDQEDDEPYEMWIDVIFRGLITLFMVVLASVVLAGYYGREVSASGMAVVYLAYFVAEMFTLRLNNGRRHGRGRPL